ncbi:hypothetical protein HDU76_006344 [Blyttiomyces sp. JEL0837]|nr:hypothetical protein HDU76_006344 [Blyttiomyces sp. JEL0837]
MASDDLNYNDDDKEDVEEVDPLNNMNMRMDIQTSHNTSFDHDMIDSSSSSSQHCGVVRLGSSKSMIGSGVQQVESFQSGSLVGSDVGKQESNIKSQPKQRSLSMLEQRNSTASTSLATISESQQQQQQQQPEHTSNTLLATSESQQQQQQEPEHTSNTLLATSESQQQQHTLTELANAALLLSEEQERSSGTQETQQQQQPIHEVNKDFALPGSVDSHVTISSKSIHDQPSSTSLELQVRDGSLNEGVAETSFLEPVKVKGKPGRPRKRPLSSDIGTGDGGDDGGQEPKQKRSRGRPRKDKTGDIVDVGTLNDGGVIVGSSSGGGGVGDRGLRNGTINGEMLRVNTTGHLVDDGDLELNCGVLGMGDMSLISPSKSQSSVANLDVIDGFKPFVCLVDGCGKAYKNPNGLIYHMAHVHPDIVVVPHTTTIAEPKPKRKRRTKRELELARAMAASHEDIDHGDGDYALKKRPHKQRLSKRDNSSNGNKNSFSIESLITPSSTIKSVRPNTTNSATIKGRCRGRPKKLNIGGCGGGGGDVADNVTIKRDINENTLSLAVAAGLISKRQFSKSLASSVAGNSDRFDGEGQGPDKDSGINDDDGDSDIDGSKFSDSLTSLSYVSFSSEEDQNNEQVDDVEVSHHVSLGKKIAVGSEGMKLGKRMENGRPRLKAGVEAADLGLGLAGVGTTGEKTRRSWGERLPKIKLSPGSKMNAVKGSDVGKIRVGRPLKLNGRSPKSAVHLVTKQKLVGDVVGGSAADGLKKRIGRPPKSRLTHGTKTEVEESVGQSGEKSKKRIGRPPKSSMRQSLVKGVVGSVGSRIGVNLKKRRGRPPKSVLCRVSDRVMGKDNDDGRSNSEDEMEADTVGGDSLDEDAGGEVVFETVMVPSAVTPGVFERHFLCPHPGCGRAYKQKHGLVYHLQKGKGSNHGIYIYVPLVDESVPREPSVVADLKAADHCNDNISSAGGDSSSQFLDGEAGDLGVEGNEVMFQTVMVPVNGEYHLQKGKGSNHGIYIEVPVVNVGPEPIVVEVQALPHPYHCPVPNCYSQFRNEVTFQYHMKYHES